MEEIKKEQIDLLEKIAGYSKNEARDLVMKKVEEMMNLMNLKLNWRITRIS